MGTVLLSDVGGTNIRFACLQDGVLTSIEHFKRTEFNSLEEAINLYLSLLKKTPDSMIFGVAGLVENNASFLTNGQWFVDGMALQKIYGNDFVLVVNDFVLQGYGILGLKEKDLFQIGSGTIQKENPCIVLGPGTGLGICFLIYDSVKGYCVLPSEGGHTSVCALTENQQKIINVMAEHKNHLSFERLLSGSGLCLLYQAICKIGKDLGGDFTWMEEMHQMQEAFQSILLDENSPKNVFENIEAEQVTALAEKGYTNAVLTFWYFFQFLGIFAGNMALSLKTSGGVFFVGDLLSNNFIKTLLARSYFRKYFENKGRFSTYLNKIPTFLVLKKDIPFSGLTYLASRFKNTLE